MKVGIPLEISPNELRVAATPKTVKRLLAVKQIKNRKHEIVRQIPYKISFLLFHERWLPSDIVPVYILYLPYENFDGLPRQYLP